MQNRKAYAHKCVYIDAHTFPLKEYIYTCTHMYNIHIQAYKYIYMYIASDSSIDVWHANLI